jgi:hypothetical protein
MGVRMKLRFVQGNSIVSQAIVARENVAMPFTPSHVEAVSRDGKSYIGAHIEDGIRSRPIGYDIDTMAHELILDLGIEGDAAAFAYMESKIGEPYDWHGILDFILPSNFHAPDHAFCSAFMALTLRKKGFFEWPLASPAHMISPRDLLLIISGRLAIPGV